MRLRAEDRRRMILRAAGELFLTRGYAGVTMEEITAASGGSKATLYQQFADKTDLFRAAVESLLDERSAPLRAYTPNGDADLAETLVELGRRFADAALSPTAIALQRLVSAEADRVPGLGEAFFDHGPRVGQAVLARQLDRAVAAGVIRSVDSAMAAAQLYQAMLGDFQMRLLICAPRVPTAEEIDASVRTAVRVFLHGVRVL